MLTVGDRRNSNTSGCYKQNIYLCINRGRGCKAKASSSILVCIGRSYGGSVGSYGRLCELSHEDQGHSDEEIGSVVAPFAWPNYRLTGVFVSYPYASGCDDEVCATVVVIVCG